LSFDMHSTADIHNLLICKFPNPYVDFMNIPY